MAGTNASGRKGKKKAKPQVVAEFTAECPESLPERGQAYWAEVVPMLVARGVLTDLDAFNVERLCQLYAEWHECVDTINEDGIFIKHYHDRGTVNKKAHPAVAMKKDAEAEIGRLSAKFGLTPKDREQIKAHKNKVTRSIRSEY